MSKSTTGSARWLFAACKVRTGDPLSKLVLIALADRANDEGRCWPSIETIADDCECGVTAVKKRLTKLTKLGLIERIPVVKDGMKRPNMYRITIDGRYTTIDGRDATIDGREAASRWSRGDHKTPIETPIGSYTRAEAFDVFWEAYPRKTEKPRGEKAFHTHVKDEFTLNAILANIRARLAAGDWRLDRKKFIPHPATYLNNARWNDEVIHDEDPPNDDGPGTDPRRLSEVERVKAERSRADRGVSGPGEGPPPL